MVSMWALLSLGACSKSDAPKQLPPEPAPAPQARASSPRITKLVERMQTHDLAALQTTLDEISAIAKQEAFAEDEGAQLLRATRSPFPKTEDDVPSQIILAVGQRPRDSYAVVIEEMWPTWKQPAREAALRVLSRIASPAATAVYVRLLKQFVAEPGLATARPIFEELEKKPHHAKEIVPTLMDLTQRPPWIQDAYLVVLAYCHQGLLQPRLYPGKLDSVLVDWRAERAWLGSKAPAATEEYAAHRDRAGVLLDLLQCVPGDAAIAELRAALAGKDASLVYFAAISLLEREQEVPAEALERVASAPAWRGRLHDWLSKHGQLDKMPVKYLTQTALAEADLAAWLEFPTELGRAPDEMALGKIVTIDGNDYYLFKFRTLGAHWAAKKGWMAGISGPYEHDAEPTSRASGTFSSLEPYAGKTPEQHVAALAKLTDR